MSGPVQEKYRQLRIQNFAIIIQGVPEVILVCNIDVAEEEKVTFF